MRRLRRERGLFFTIINSVTDPILLTDTAGLRATGAEPVVADALDRDAVLRAVVAARPEVVVHQLTALAGTISFRRFDQAFALTNRLRTEGTDHLLEAARAAGTRRFVAQSFAGWPFARVGGPVKTEDDPLDPAPPAKARESFDAMRYLEEAVTRAGGIALRYGIFYGAADDGLTVGRDHVECVPVRGTESAHLPPNAARRSA